MEEFSDFQMAVEKPPSSYGGGGSNGLDKRFPDSSPVRSLQSSTKSDFVLASHQFTLSPSIKPVVPGPIGGNVGSRLANYDLGLSFPSQTMNGNDFQQQQSMGMSGFSSNQRSAPPKTITNPSGKNNQDLLIGEEDKYSALRMFMETTDDGASIFETSSKSKSISEASVPLPSETYSNSSHSRRTTVPASVKSNHAGLNPTVNSANFAGSFDSPNIAVGSIDSDFGDFQSFTGFTAPEPAKISNSMPVFTSPAVTKSNFVPFQSIGVSPVISNSAACIGETPKVTDNGSYDSDGEFGDFVSVEPVIQKPVAVASTYLPSFFKPQLNLSPSNIIAESLSSSQSQPPPLPTEDVKEPSQNIESLLGLDSFLSPSASVDDIQLPTQDPEQHSQTIKYSSPNRECDFDPDFTSRITSNKSNLDIFATPSSPSGSLEKRNSNSSNLDFSLEPSNDSSSQSISNIPPTFIRTSLIRNDEVTDIDPVKWNQSIDDGPSDPGLDFIPYERREGGGKSKFLDISPETRSIASLDLGNYVTVDSELTTHVNNNNKTFIDQVAPLQNSNHQPSGKLGPSALLPLTSLISDTDEGNVYDENDKYQCFREECENEKERYLAEWTRCLVACKLNISKAYCIFNGVSTSEVIREIVADEKGYSYVMNILEIYRVSQRVQKSAESLGLESKLRSSCLEINNLWETLITFFLGTCVSTEVCEESDAFQDQEASPHRDNVTPCGVCLCPVAISQVNQCLDYGGKIYHSKCANFWVNEVDAILPSLSSYLNSPRGSSAGSATNSAIHYTNSEPSANKIR